MKARLIIVFAFFVCTASFAQQGSYISPYFMYQMTSLPNYQDQMNANNTNKLKFENSFHPAFGINYIYNSTNYFGFQTGFKWSEEGQKYSGLLEYDVNLDSSFVLNFTSSATISYLQVPFLLRFNTDFDEDLVIMSISTGFQLDFLTSAKMVVDPKPSIANEIDLKQLFRKNNLKYVAETSFTFLISDNWLLTTGLQWTRSLSDIENKNFAFDKTKHVAEYYFPVSTKKEMRTDISTRYKTTSMTFGLMFGVSYWLTQP